MSHVETRAEHLEWCKTRALEYIDRGDLVNAFASFASDVEKHPETTGLMDALAMTGMAAVMNNDVAELRRFIEGFR